MQTILTTLLVLIGIGLAAAPSCAQNQENRPRPEETEIWSPVPPVVETGTSPAPVAPPSDAVVLFDGTSLDEWVNVRDGAPAGWILEDGVMTVHKPAGDIRTRR